MFTKKFKDIIEVGKFQNIEDSFKVHENIGAV